MKYKFKMQEKTIETTRKFIELLSKSRSLSNRLRIAIFKNVIKNLDKTIELIDNIEKLTPRQKSKQISQVFSLARKQGKGDY